MSRHGNALTLFSFLLLSSAILLPVRQGYARPSQGAIPHFDHVVVVFEENKSFDDVIGSSQAPYINALANTGALFTHASGITHPSEPNYVAFFSGTTHGIDSDKCPVDLSGPNLASQLSAQGLHLVTYAESLPAPGYLGCYDGAYARKHNPAANWQKKGNLPPSDTQPFSAFPTDFNQLPAVALVIPNQKNDMHSGTIKAADTWLRNHLGAYEVWARAHNSLLIITWDEGYQLNNRIPLIMVGSHVHPGRYDTPINHYNVLHTLESMYGLPPLNESASHPPITSIW